MQNSVVVSHTVRSQSHVRGPTILGTLGPPLRMGRSWPIETTELYVGTQW